MIFIFPISRYVPIGSKFFTSNGCLNLGGGCEMWPGFHLTVRPTGRWKLMLNIDVSATAFIRPVSVIEYLYDITGYDCTQTNTPLKDFQRRTFSKQMKGKSTNELIQHFHECRVQIIGNLLNIALNCHRNCGPGLSKLYIFIILKIKIKIL